MLEISELLHMTAHVRIKMGSGDGIAKNESLLMTIYTHIFWGLCWVR